MKRSTGQMLERRIAAVILSAVLLVTTIVVVLPQASLSVCATDGGTTDVNIKDMDNTYLGLSSIEISTGSYRL